MTLGYVRTRQEESSFFTHSFFKSYLMTVILQVFPAKHCALFLFLSCLSGGVHEEKVGALTKSGKSA